MICRVLFTVFGVIICGSLVFGVPSSLSAQVLVDGRITDAETKEPLHGAHVFLSGTTIRTSTDSSGRYELRQIPPGAHRMVVSMIGYSNKTNNLVLSPEETKSMNFDLTPVIYEMDEILVGHLDKKWKRRLERFEDLFLGQTQWADSIRILNPEVLRFDANLWGRFTARALAPLQIENRALGYHIIYYLKEFEHTGIRTRWDGEPLFSEMTSSDLQQQSRWEKNRRQAFYGSMRHFLLALQGDRLEEEGFVLYNVRDNNLSGLASERRFRIATDKVIDKKKEGFLYEMRFFGELEIIYTREKEDRRYVKWGRNLNRGPAASQTSRLELNERPVTIDSDGEMLEPYGATQMGYFAFQRLADQTPREYRPKGYSYLNEK